MFYPKDQGVAAYTFRDERDPLWYSTVFSSAERESAYVIDGLMHNEVVKSDIHSTDAFGFSELVFAVSHLLGFSYAPRFKNLERQRLYIFRSRKGSDRSAWKIKPAGYADDEIVIQQWDEILRLIATIKLKEVTASDLFRRLNSYSKQHALYQALKAFGQVPKSLFILQVIDDPVLRQAIEKQLDRSEHVHRFTASVNGTCRKLWRYCQKLCIGSRGFHPQFEDHGQCCDSRAGTFSSMGSKPDGGEGGFDGISSP